MYSKVMVNVFRIAVIAVVIIAILGTVAGFAAFKGILDTTTPIELAVLEVKGYTSTSLYSDGTIAQNFAGPSANRIEITMEQVPDSVKYAFMAAEDHRFYEHNGIDIRTIFRSGFSLFREGANPGGSTFTQQLIKNQVFGGGGETYFIDKVQRKIQEQYLAINLEHVSTKDEIFAYYLNMVNLGNRTYGVETASLGYICSGLQSMTIWKNTAQLASTTCDMVNAILNGNEPSASTTYNNGTIEVPSNETAITVITIDNISEPVEAGYVRASDIEGYDDTINSGQS